MAKYCPIIKEKVLYLECLECKTKECKNFNNINKQQNNKKDSKKI